MPVNVSNAFRLEFIKTVEKLDTDNTAMLLQFEMQAPRLIKPGEVLHFRLVITEIDGDVFRIVAALDE